LRNFAPVRVAILASAYSKRNSRAEYETQTMTDTIFTTHRVKIPLTQLNPAMAKLAWEKLTAFQDWHQWMPAIVKVTADDGGDFGRGSTLRVHTHNSSRTWSISCWDPPKRLEFIIESGGRDLAYGFSIVADKENQELIIELDIECEPRGFRRLIARFLAWRQQRHGQNLLHCFTQSLPTQ
jgi:hypothetical protein